MSKNISQQTRLTAECASAAAEAFSIDPAAAQLVDRAAALQRNGASADLRTLLSGQDSTLRAAVTRLVPDAGLDLEVALAPAALRWRLIQSDLVVDAAVEATQTSSFGFEALQVTRADDVVSILASTGRSALLVRVDRETGLIERDWQVGPGDACVGLDAEWTEVLEKRGIRTTTIQQDLHNGRRDGERLIAPATAIAPDEPTVGSVLDFRRGGAAQSLRQATTRTAPAAVVKPVTR